MTTRVGTLIAATPSAVSYALLGAAVVGSGRPGPLTLAAARVGLLLTAVVAYRAARTLRRARADRRAALRDPEPAAP